MTCGDVVEDFEGWYLQRRPRLIGTLVALCANADLAADAADEACSKALERWDRVSAMDSPDAWVTRVAINEMKRQLRRRNLEVRLLRRRPLVDATQPPTPHSEIWDAVGELPARQRLAVVLRYVGDFDEADISTVMGVARGTVAATLFTARARLADTLADPALLPDSAQPDSAGMEAPHG